MPSFVAIDFETADHGADSACAIGVVRVEDHRIVAEGYRLIRPPRSTMLFTGIHGIRWRDVEGEPPFPDVWADLADLVRGADFLVAHNAPFDRRVLRACCATAGLPSPATDWICTVRVARAAWALRPARLPDVCRHLGLALDHHDAASDARACANILIAARDQGVDVGQAVLRT